jgi:hypothetical protein
MNVYRALQIVDGLTLESDIDDASLIEAWQCLIDVGYVWQAPGRYGREAQALIEEGLCVPAPGDLYQ